MIRNGWLAVADRVSSIAPSMKDVETAEDRLRSALEMWDDGVCMMRERLRRLHPSASSTEIQAALDRWLATRPGAEDGDGDGVVVAWPRPQR